MARYVLAVVLLLVAASARAQPYVAATVGADVTRLSHSTSSFMPQSSSGASEVFSWSLRVGTAVAERWGVELEFVSSGRSRASIPIGIAPLITGSTVTLAPPGTVLPNTPVPVSFTTDVRRSHTDFDTVAWVRQPAGGSVDLVYLGGVAFSRQRLEVTQTFPSLLAVFVPGGPTFRTTTINYGARPVVGAEARIGLTSHMRLVPGIRLQGLNEGWLLRPYAGLGWFF